MTGSNSRWAKPGVRNRHAMPSFIDDPILVTLPERLALDHLARAVIVVRNRGARIRRPLSS